MSSPSKAHGTCQEPSTRKSTFGSVSIEMAYAQQWRMRNMMKVVESIAKNGRSAMFGFACRPDLSQFTRAPAPDGRMFRDTCRRVGYEDLILASAGK
jgi:hypothetical protein